MQTSSMAQGPDMPIVFRAKEKDMFQFDTNDSEELWAYQFLRRG